MQEFTGQRGPETEDELWVTEHPPVFTLGHAERGGQFLLEPSIEVVKTDRGGQVTYHGPGQIVGYTLVDLKRAQISVHGFVSLLEQAMIDTLGTYDVQASRLHGNPGVYVAGRKIGSLGLRVQRGCAYHGVSLNVNMDLAPFASFDPCGIPGMTVTQIADLVAGVGLNDVATRFIEAVTDLWQREDGNAAVN